MMFYEKNILLFVTSLTQPSTSRVAVKMVIVCVDTDIAFGDSANASYTERRQKRGREKKRWEERDRKRARYIERE